MEQKYLTSRSEYSRHGYAIDAILIDPEAVSAPIRIEEEFDTPDDQLQKIVNNATRANIAKVWVRGKKVVDSTITNV